MISEISSLTERLFAFRTGVQFFSTVRRWFLRFPASLNDCLHSVHLCGSSQLWVKRWRLRCSALLKDLVHSAHLCSFSPLWIKRCSLRVPAMLNDFVHWEHVCDFSPLWVNRCRFRILALLNYFLHSAHLCGFSPLWVRRPHFQRELPWCDCSVSFYSDFFSFHKFMAIQPLCEQHIWIYPCWESFFLLLRHTAFSIR